MNEQQPQQPPIEYGMGENLLLRRQGHMILQVYRGQGQWEDFDDDQVWFTRTSRLDEAEAQQQMQRVDAGM